MVRTGNVDFSCKRLTSIEIRKSKYHIIRRVRFRWDPPPPPRERYLDPRLKGYTCQPQFNLILILHNPILSCAQCGPNGQEIKLQFADII